MPIFDFKCELCGELFERKVNHWGVIATNCFRCGAMAYKQFHATSNLFVPSYFHTNRSDIFSDTEWQALKKDPNIERAR